ncbi:MAG TPA: site-2 protease family protein [Candidatus Peribacteria bacterium]|nr:site-2 protease family protein [Candidatus Peribacteria bacterium]
MPFPIPDLPFIIAVLIALTVHEYSHGQVAYWLGDPTAKHEGRLTLNPVAHLDALGTLMFFLIRFGWGKPVPVNPRYFKHYRRDTALVALAGPVSNLLLALGAFLILAFLVPKAMPADADILMAVNSSSPSLKFIVEILSTSVIVNLGLMAFNLLPIAPLDGSKVLAAFVPLKYEDLYDQYLQYGTYILLGLLVLERMFNVPILMGWIYGIINPILHLMSLIGGI